MTVIIYDTVSATKFWIPVICVLLLSAIVVSVILFQKLVQYNEETGKRAILENQVRQMQKEIAEIQDIYTDMRGLRHDMRSHIAWILGFTWRGAHKCLKQAIPRHVYEIFDCDEDLYWNPYKSSCWQFYLVTFPRIQDIANISLLVKNVAGSVNEELESYIGALSETQ